MRFLQRHLGWAALPNVTLWIIVVQVCVYLAQQVPMRGLDPGEMTERLWLDPHRVWAGEWWRVVTFAFIPPQTNLLFAFFFWWLFHLMGTSLELFWGTFRYNVYLWVWWLGTVAVSLVSRQAIYQNYYMEESVFLAFAWLNPEFTLMLFFILPVKIKWLAWLAWFGIVMTVATGDWGQRAATIAAVTNFLIFLGPEVHDYVFYGARRMRREAVRRTQREPAYRHKCTVCGITDATDPSIEFRYCSKCDGNLCFCSDHLRDHEHATKPEVAVPEP
ncbi:MAG: hypothetical protein KDA75_10710 [Planctomycetaceae bacterium]|nr:hypothetical protein [Planctomycetaceae bacterium]